MAGRLLMSMLWFIITELFDDTKSEIELLKAFSECCPMECESWEP